MAKKKKEEKQSVSDIMEEIIDKEALAKRKEASMSHLPKKRENVKKEEPKELKWYQKPIKPEDFIKRKSKKGNIYVQHKEWKSFVWIGPYDDKTADRIISDYVKNYKKDVLNRKPIKDLHSVILIESDWEAI